MGGEGSSRLTVASVLGESGGVVGNGRSPNPVVGESGGVDGNGLRWPTLLPF